jgi:hypothetical protein
MGSPASTTRASAVARCGSVWPWRRRPSPPARVRSAVRRPAGRQVGRSAGRPGRRGWVADQTPAEHGGGRRAPAGAPTATRVAVIAASTKPTPPGVSRTAARSSSQLAAAQAGLTVGLAYAPARTWSSTTTRRHFRRPGHRPRDRCRCSCRRRSVSRSSAVVSSICTILRCGLLSGDGLVATARRPPAWGTAPRRLPRRRRWRTMRRRGAAAARRSGVAGSAPGPRRGGRGARGAGRRARLW